MKQRSTTAGQHSFANIPSAEIQRSSFDRSCGLKTTFDSGLLIPIFCDEALPGDTMSMRVSTFGRMATPLHPIIDNLYLDTFFFAVPLRLLWVNWQRFNGEQDDPADSTDFQTPIIDSQLNINIGDISDYMGMPTGVSPIAITAFHHRAYNLIYKEWFRDQNLVNSPPINTGDGPDDIADYKLLRRGKRHDYFTSCMPWPQKGPAVQIPLADSAPVVLDPGQNFLALPIATNTAPVMSRAGQTDAATLQIKAGGGSLAEWDVSPAGTAGDANWITPGLHTDVGGATGVTDLTAATAITINALREAFQIQRLYERDARGGTRYTEILRSHFGVTSPDARLQRPEYLGGSSSPINITSVPQTSETGTTAQGNLAGFATVQSTGGGFSKSFVEHCVILGLASVRADLNYQQGLNRMFSRRTRWDYYWPALAHLGEQAVISKEIFMAGDASDEDVFGYQERFAEYRYKPSQITGHMRSSSATSLDTWHLAQDFAGRPILDEAFISENPPIARIIAVPTEPEFLLDVFFKYRSVRPMPTYGVPGLIDHF